MQIRQILLFIVLGCSFVSCSEKQKNISVSLSSFSNLIDPCYAIDKNSFDKELQGIVLADKKRLAPDVFAKTYYQNHGHPLWVTQSGVSRKADSVIAYIEKVDEMGFNRESFGFLQLRNDLQAFRNLDFKEASASLMSARLEYNLTKAFLCYSAGQRFGFINPYKVFNRLDKLDTTSVRSGYRSLYGIKTKTADSTFFHRAIEIAHDDDSVALFLAESKPSNPVYYKLLKAFQSASSQQHRQKLLCNMERCRWHQDVYPHQYQKYVWVNIPSLSLQAFDGAQTLDMRVCLGSLATKTPMLNSYIKRMDFNPQWIIPMSIIKSSVCHYAGDADYFNRHNYFIKERKTGKTVDPTAVTSDMLRSGSYAVVQRGGNSNALGRVVFRFDNDYSVFLHYTSNPGVFSRSHRTISHGCVRVEKPLDLAVFMLADKDDALIGKINHSITAEYDSSPAGNKASRRKMLGSLRVKPEVPVFIAYYTLYPDSQGRLEEFPDIYGYDKVVLDGIRKFIR